MNYIDQLKKTGFIPCSFTLPPLWKELTLSKDYDSLFTDVSKELQRKSMLWKQINEWVFQIFKDDQAWNFEWMIALREGPQDIEQEGIWHDDSSRDLALSLSLNLSPELIDGGQLSLRPMAKRQEVTTIAPRPWGNAHLFATGKLHWEHKTSIVNNGNRLVLVVWISLCP